MRAVAGLSQRSPECRSTSDKVTGPEGTGYQHRRSRPVRAQSRGGQDSSVPVASPRRASPSSPILSGWCACSERKARHDMAGLAKCTATTSGWTLVPCDCRNRIHQVRQRRVARARRRWRPQPVHGGCDVQDRTRASIAHDACDCNIFFPSVDAAARRTAELRRGARERTRRSSCESTKRHRVCQTGRPDRQLPDQKGGCGDVRFRCR